MRKPDNWMPRRGSDAMGALAAALTLTAEIGVILLLNRFGLAGNAAVVLTLMLLPVVVYAVTTGRLKELRGPGGWLATFTDASLKTLRREDLLPVKFRIVVQEEFQPPPEDLLRRHPTVLLIALSSVPREFPICEYVGFLDSLFASASVRYLVVEDASGLFLGMAPLKSIAEVPELLTPDGECRAGVLVDWIENNEILNLGRIPGFVSEPDAARMDWDRRTCLTEMLRRGIEALPVVSQGRLMGIVESTKLTTLLVADLAEHMPAQQ